MNKVILMGRAGADPEITKNGAGSFSLATSYKKSNGDEVTEWHRIKVFGKTAEITDRYIRKGARVLIEGRIQTQKWEDKFYTDIVVERLEIIDFPDKETNKITTVDEEGYFDIDKGQAFDDNDVPF